MHRKPAARALTAAALILVVVTAGCTTRNATLQAWRPAEVDLAGVRTVAVLDVTGPSDLGRQTTEALIEQLEQAGELTVVDQAELNRVAQVSPYFQNGAPDVRAALQASRQLGVDLLVVGRLDCRINGSSELGATRLSIGSTKYDADLEWKAIDVASGRMRAAKNVAHHESTPPSESPAEDPHPQEMLGRLVRQCGQDAGRAITPHQEPVEVELAGAYWGKGASQVREGNEMAAKGDWETALRCWQLAADENPNSHAAIYNIGLAHEAQQDYEQARLSYAAALRVSQKDTYQQALARVDRAAQQQQLVVAQRRPPPPNRTGSYVANVPRRGYVGPEMPVTYPPPSSQQAPFFAKSAPGQGPFGASPAYNGSMPPTAQPEPSPPPGDRPGIAHEGRYGFFPRERASPAQPVDNPYAAVGRGAPPPDERPERPDVSSMPSNYGTSSTASNRYFDRAPDRGGADSLFGGSPSSPSVSTSPVYPDAQDRWR